MKLDDLDVFILQEIYGASIDKKNITTWEMTKGFCKDERKRRMINMKIKFRLEKFSKYDLVVKDKNTNGKIVYVLNLNKLTFCKHKCDDGYKMGL